MRIFDFMSYGERYKGYLQRNTYANNNNIAIDIVCIDKNGEHEPWCNLTTNIIPLANNLAVIDTNHLQGSNVLDVLVNEGLLKETGKGVRSGFCVYPVYEIVNIEEWC